MAKSRERELTRAEAIRIQQEVIRRASQIQKVDFKALCHPAQLAFVEDTSQFLAALCGRQGGKTEGAAIKALDAAQRNAHCIVPYITLSRPSAKRNFWPKLLKLDRDLGIGAKFNHADLTMTLPNGSQIILGGANDEAEIERYRGLSIPLAIVDEAQAFRSFLDSLVVEILLPATIAYNGQIVLIGTPNPACMGFFYDVTAGPRASMWSIHRWTAYENPFLPDPAGFIERYIEANGYTKDHPRVRREWFAEWVRNDEGLVYEIKPWNIVDQLPEADDWCHVLGMDVGYTDATAFVVIAYSETLGQAFVVWSYQRTGMIPSAIVAEVERLQTRYEFESIVVDPGGGGKFIVEEMRQRYGLGAEVAQKRAKLASIESLNGDLRANTFGIVGPGNADLLHDASLLQWDFKRVARKEGHWGGHVPTDQLLIDDRTPDHLLDAMLYAYRKTHAHLWDAQREAASPGTPDWYRAQEQELMDMALAKAKRMHPDEEDEEAWWEA